MHALGWGGSESAPECSCRLPLPRGTPSGMLGHWGRGGGGSELSASPDEYRSGMRSIRKQLT